MTQAPLDPALKEAPYPFQRLLGYELTAWEPDHARMEIAIAEALENRQGVVQGGVAATLLDTAMGFAGCYTGDPEAPRHCATLSINVNYLAVATGSRLICDGYRTGGGRKTFFAEGRVTDDAGNLVATGTSVFRYITLGNRTQT
ncbi:hotdog fold thioesterase [Aquicoccus sp. SCR17]|nr:hotdog fold thioesterase [Carideicomes alvinocaridis]